MKKFILLCVCIIGTATLFAQGEGSKTKYNLAFGNADISSVTAKWRFSILLGEPIINGSYKWEGTGKLHANDFIILKVQANGDPDIYAWVKIDPAIPEADGDYGYNMARSPNWDETFCGYDENGRVIRCWSAENAKHFWKNGFTVIDFKFKRKQ
ncbi:hypothetical protein [Neptunitalea lumnitzerae]|uniref:Uncharacterized protein n=1 Tax=Neptunitalea lumnitzerae TaxID=2965509 RepID=A0ABQ5MEH6_9FLAO|nr:hypothetical protein [Neptunitalea sp. Y10]GLB47790.1 hypothetical protein Y10_01580 [Neptunitalea sp. Y10]